MYNKINYKTNSVNRIVRNDLGVVASSRCIFFGCLEIYTDGKLLNVNKN
jgi:hypothetical protein